MCSRHAHDDPIEKKAFIMIAGAVARNMKAGRSVGAAREFSLGGLLQKAAPQSGRSSK
jgi:hypothetical protein